MNQLTQKKHIPHIAAYLSAAVFVSSIVTPAVHAQEADNLLGQGQYSVDTEITVCAASFGLGFITEKLGMPDLSDVCPWKILPVAVAAHRAELLAKRGQALAEKGLYFSALAVKEFNEDAIVISEEYAKDFDAQQPFGFYDNDQNLDAALTKEQLAELKKVRKSIAKTYKKKRKQLQAKFDENPELKAYRDKAVLYLDAGKKLSKLAKVGVGIVTLRASKFVGDSGPAGTSANEVAMKAGAALTTLKSLTNVISAGSSISKLRKDVKKSAVDKEYVETLLEQTKTATNEFVQQATLEAENLT